MASNSNRVKTRKKSSAYWKHGKRKDREALAAMLNREGGKKKPKPEMFETVKEAFKQK